ncbi:MAG: anhydro-N-acetylmuramic acid kinase, partial [Gammaproteobacteria bacterium]|nr:anhydro-N-acetylmuramic acid kinase [Gammaproteobacteria bacterium]
YYIGLMSGTSVDGIDAALVDINDGKIKCLATKSIAFDAPLRNALIKACSKSYSSSDQAAELDSQLAYIYAKTVTDLLNISSADQCNIVIGCHGQTINHAPNASPSFSLQIGNAQKLANLCKIPVVSDFRSKDLAAGGQGAPLAPAFHATVFRSTKESRVVLNLGGIANISVLSKDNNTDVIGFDTGPANGLMDYWINKHLEKHFDDAGQWAASGQFNSALLETLLDDDYFTLTPPKSTGRELFNADWLEHKLSQFTTLPSKDVQATLCELSAITVANDIKRYAADCQRVLVCGGGVHNIELKRRLQQHLPNVQIVSTATLGVDPDFVEAIAFAWLAQRHVNKLTGNLPSVTGASKKVILGTLTTPTNR